MRVSQGALGVPEASSLELTARAVPCTSQQQRAHTAEWSPAVDLALSPCNHLVSSSSCWLALPRPSIPPVPSPTDSSSTPTSSTVTSSISVPMVSFATDRRFLKHYCCMNTKMSPGEFLIYTSIGICTGTCTENLVLLKATVECSLVS